MMINTDIHIPERAPKIGIRSLEPAVESVRVDLRGDPFHFGTFDVGDDFTVCDYDLPDETLSQVSRGQTRGPVWFQGYRCTEILSRELSAGGEPLQLVRRLVSRGTRFARILLISLRRPTGMGSVEITNLEFPVSLEPRNRWQVIRGAGSGNPPEMNIERITGLMEVCMGKQKFQCLRWLRPRTTGFGYREAEEIFIEINSGLTVLIRGFVGSDFPDLEKFQRSPKLEVAGEIFYLRYIRRVLRQDDLIPSEPVV
ncbi:hypothetical protein JW823_03680 [bacterium]|nr:hypothetical protein [candidate division CSSED10-310 bacterium]